MECLGCKIVNRLETEANVVYEDRYIAAILDIEPFNDGHLLILPKAHYLDLEEIDEKTLAAIMNATVTMSKLLKKLFKPDGITICQNGGVFNDLTHYHMHVIPRYIGDGFSWSNPKQHFKSVRTLKETRDMLVDGCID